MSAARTPATLFAHTDAPTPLPQIATPRSTVPAATARGERHHEIRVVVVDADHMGSEFRARVVAERRLGIGLELRNDPLPKHLAELDAPLVERVDVPDRALKTLCS